MIEIFIIIINIFLIIFNFIRIVLYRMCYENINPFCWLIRNEEVLLEVICRWLKIPTLIFMMVVLI